MEAILSGLSRGTMYIVAKFGMNAGNGEHPHSRKGLLDAAEHRLARFDIT